MTLTNIKLGDYIKKSTKNNNKLLYGEELIEGVSNQGIFTHPKGNTKGVNLKPYKIIENGAFVYNPTRLNIGSIAYRTDGLCIVSHLYIVFYLTEEGKKIIHPDYLFMYFRRKEFLREVEFRNFGSQRPEFSFKDMSEIIIPLPPFHIQEKYVAVYKSMLDNQKAYETGLEDLKLVCDATIEKLRREMKKEKIGNYLELCTEKNEGRRITKVCGVDSSGVFIPTKAKMAGIDTAKYSVVNVGDIVYNPSRINIGSVALCQEDCIVSPMYIVFNVSNKDKLLTEYLFMWLSRRETQRYILFKSVGSVRDIFDFSLMKDYEIPIPDIDIQKSLVNIYMSYVKRKTINEKLKQQIKDICPILISGAIKESNDNG